VAEEFSHRFSRLKSFLREGMWDADPPSISRRRAFFNRQIRIAYLVGQGYIEDLLSLQALALAFKTLLSLVPFLAVCFSVLKGLGVHNRLQPFLVEVLSPLGSGGEEVSHRLIGFVDNVNVNALGAIGIVTLFVTVLSLMGSVEEALNKIWRVKTPRRLSRRFSDYLSVLLVGPVLLFSALALTASLQSHGLVRQLIAIEPFGKLIVVMLGLIPYLVMWGMFTFIYTFIPNTAVKPRSALIGGLAGAILWQTAGWGFAALVASSTAYYAIYSSFAILIVFLLWLNIGWMIVLFGAEVAFAHQYVDFHLPSKGDYQIGAAARERLGLQVMTLIGLHFYNRCPPWTSENLARRLHAPQELIEELLSAFTKNELLALAADARHLLPARDLEQISVQEILDTVRGSADGSRPAFPSRADRDPVDEVIRKVNDSIAVALEGTNLKHLIRENAAATEVDPPQAVPGRASNE
jgi:membrane protein